MWHFYFSRTHEKGCQLLALFIYFPIHVGLVVIGMATGGTGDAAIATAEKAGAAASASMGEAAVEAADRDAAVGIGGRAVDDDVSQNAAVGIGGDVAEGGGATFRIHPDHPLNAREEDVKVKLGVAKWDKDAAQYNENYRLLQSRQDMNDPYYVDAQEARQKTLGTIYMGPKDDEIDYEKLSRSRVYKLWRNEGAFKLLHYIDDPLELVDRDDFFIALKCWSDQAPDLPSTELL